MIRMYTRTRPTNARQRLRHVLRHEKDEQRTAVLVLGDGLNREAARTRGVGDTDSWTKIVDRLWLTMVGVPAPPARSSRTAQWSRLIRMAAARRGSSMATARAAVARKAGKLILELERRPEAHADIYATIMAARFAHLISLNVDRRLVLQKGAKSFRGYHHGSRAERRVVRKTDGGSTTVWFPYGIAHRPETLELDHGSHATRLMGMEDLRDEAMEAWRIKNYDGFRMEISLRRPEEVFRREWSNLDWYQLLLVAPLVIVGSSLSQDDWPIWWLLHQRHRTLAPFRKGPFPWTFCLYTNADPVKHLRGRTAGIETIRFQSYDTLWRFFLDELN